MDENLYLLEEDTTPSVSAADTLADDMAESVQIALGDGASQAWVPQVFSDYAYARSADRHTDRTDGTPRSVTAGDENKGLGGLVGKVSSWVEKNKSLSEMLAKGIAGAALGSQNKKAAEIQAQSRLDELKMKNQQEMEKDAKTSASVSGLRGPGLMGRIQPPLRRINGTQVYQNGRIV